MLSKITNNFSIIQQSLVLIGVLASVECTCSMNYFETYYESPPSDNGRNAVKSKRYKWPNGIVPYTFDDSYSGKDRDIVLAAMKGITDKSCVKFVPKQSSDVEHIRFVTGQGCGSNIGYRPNRTEPLNVTYSNYCLSVFGAVQHEMLHVLGLFHEQNRPDRDDYVYVLWENIDSRYYQNFNKMSSDVVETFDLPYDYESLMHYPKNAFAKPNTNVTIVSRVNPDQGLGQNNGPTFYDLEKIRKMYNC